MFSFAERPKPQPNAGVPLRRAGGGPRSPIYRKEAFVAAKYALNFYYAVDNKILSLPNFFPSRDTFALSK